MPSIRYHVEPRDAPPAVAARKLGLTLGAFTEKLPELWQRRFPPADPTTGNYDLRAIDRWRDMLHGQLLSGDMPTASAADARLVIRERLRNPPNPPMPAAPPVGIYEPRTYASIVEGKPLGKLERMALEGYFKAKGRPVHVNGAGLDTIGRLEARGFISAHGDGFGVSNHAITPAGEAEWRRFVGAQPK